MSQPNTNGLRRRDWLLGAAGLAAAGGAPRSAHAAEARPKPIASVATAITANNKTVIPPGSVIHIPTFRVEIVSEVSKSAETTGFAAAGSAIQTVTYKLQNLNPLQVQALTQALYDEMVAALKAKGHTVATPDQTRADPDLGPLMAGMVSPAIARSKLGSSVFMAPTGLAVVFEPLDPSNSPNAMAAFAGAGEMMKRALAANRAVTTRNIVVLQPKYTLGFVGLSSSTEGFGGRLTNVASVSGDVGLRVEPETTRWDVMVPAQNRDRIAGILLMVNAPLMAAGAALGPAMATANAPQAQGMAMANLMGMAASSYTGMQNSYGADTRSVSPSPLFSMVAQQTLSTVQGAMLARVGV